MPISEPTQKRAVAFFDGQNLYHHAKAAFGYHHPNYDPVKLLAAVSGSHGWSPSGVRFYTGVPSAAHNPMWHGYWANRLLAMARAGILVVKRPIRYHTETVLLSDGSAKQVVTPQEKGIDVRLALDVVRLARQGQFDVAVILSQDQDLAEVAQEDGVAVGLVETSGHALENSGEQGQKSNAQLVLLLRKVDIVRVSPEAADAPPQEPPQQ